AVMAGFRSLDVGELARQLRFTPLDKRLQQLTAAENLLLTLDPAKSYPLAFLIDRITGYRPKDASIRLIPGHDLQHDLGLLLETVSAGCSQCQADAGEPVLSIDTAAQRLRVASKTLQRWRRRGLPARVFTYPDGKKRIGFFLSSVERFLAAHAGELATADSAGRSVTWQEADLVSRAARLIQQGLWPEEAARRLAQRVGRSPLAVLSYLKQYEQSHPGIFAAAASPPSDQQVRFVLHAMRRRLPLRVIARRLKLTRYSVYRIWMDHELARLRARRITFIDDPLYHQPDAEALVDDLASQRPLEPSVPSCLPPRDLPPYLQELYRTPLLSPARERALFLAYNFWKARFAQQRAHLRPETARYTDLRRARDLASRAQAIRNEIVTANLRLVISVARKHLRSRVPLMDLVSEGNVALLRAVETFDTHRGHRFSTYATFALMRCFARQIPRMLQRRAVSGADPHLLEVADPRSRRDFDLLEARERLAAVWRRLTPREQEIVSGSFGLHASPMPATHGELGSRLGISRQRVQQIEQTALRKLRAFLHAPTPA
ncbi:MAG TPA: sigma-70 family RNA polymerase sigma factor, partial [Tepidisphaeraceae bacterium]|nr:sigma-70 family RNA polymerase sigma factor [Tepidisphaeraceae bacterium]